MIFLSTKLKSIHRRNTGLTPARPPARPPAASEGASPNGRKRKRDRASCFFNEMKNVDHQKVTADEATLTRDGRSLHKEHYLEKQNGFTASPSWLKVNRLYFQAPHSPPNLPRFGAHHRGMPGEMFTATFSQAAAVSITRRKLPLSGKLPSIVGQRSSKRSNGLQL